MLIFDFEHVLIGSCMSVFTEVDSFCSVSYIASPACPRFLVKQHEKLCLGKPCFFLLD